MRLKVAFALVLLLTAALPLSAHGNKPVEKDFVGYLFTYFTSEQEAYVGACHQLDGFHYFA